MKRTLISVAASIALLVGLTGTVAAVAPPTVTITSASLVARGVAVQVGYTVVCQSINEGQVDFTLDMGTWVSVDQAVSKKAIAKGFIEPTGSVVCDGRTNRLTALLKADSVPFKKVVALIGARVNMYDASYGYQAGETSVAFGLR